MLTVSLVLFGGVLMALALAQPWVNRLPLTPAVISLVIGWLAGAVLGAPHVSAIEAHVTALVLGTELAVLVSLVAVGLRLRVPPLPGTWRVALWMAGPGMVLTVALGTLAGAWLLGLPWPAAMLLAAVMAPTDPVLASEVRIRHEDDRDAVRLSLTTEGGLNDGSALPAVTLALGWMGLHELGPAGLRWLATDVAWAIGGGALLGVALGRLLGGALQASLQRGNPIARDELVFVGAVALAYGLARATGTSTFVVAFAVGATLLWPWGPPVQDEGTKDLSKRLHAFGERIERLVEVLTVMAVGLVLHSVSLTWAHVGFGLASVLIVRPLSALAVVRPHTMPRTQRRLVAWFGIRGIGTLFYLVFALEHGVKGALAEDMLAAALTAIALSIVLHGSSATPVMTAYRRHQRQHPDDLPPR